MSDTPKVDPIQPNFDFPETEPLPDYEVKNVQAEVMLDTPKQVHDFINARLLAVELDNDRTNWKAKPKPPLGELIIFDC
jgi:hypothetical protein